MDKFTVGRFLSHLSGDEVVNELEKLGKGFLSHLSGDEVNSVVGDASYYFLSHLSGDEEI